MKLLTQINTMFPIKIRYLTLLAYPVLTMAFPANLTLSTINIFQERACDGQHVGGDRCGLDYCCRSGWSAFKYICCPPNTFEVMQEIDGVTFSACCGHGTSLRGKLASDGTLQCSDGKQVADPESQCVCAVLWDEHTRACIPK